jgi:hypothetical protein
MVCDTRLRNPQQTATQRKAEVREAVKRLETALQQGGAKVNIDRNTGVVSFAGNWQRDGVSDACAYRVLTAAGSGALRMALARAEALSGTRHNAALTAAGIHSHDGGATWNAGH